MKTTARATSAATDRPLSASQIRRAWRSVGGGRLTAQNPKLETRNQLQIRNPKAANWKTMSRPQFVFLCALLWPFIGSSLSQFLRLLRRGTHSVHKRGAQPAFLQFVQAFDGGPAGAGDHILESCGVQSGVQDHSGAAEHGLRREPGGDVTRQTRGYRAITQGFDDEVDIRRATPAQAGDGIEQRLFHFKSHANSRE